MQNSVGFCIFEYDVLPPGGPAEIQVDLHWLEMQILAIDVPV